MLLEPTSIAVIGASATEGKLGHEILHNLVSQGYEGNLYPVNPKETEILGFKAYASVVDVEEDIDCAVIVIPAKLVPGVLEECKEKGIETAVIISAGFGETGTEEGQQLEQRIRETVGTPASNYQPPTPTIIGPNCLGILRPSIGMNASFAKELPPVGSVALVSQSGAMAVAVMDASEELGIGYSTVLSIGNKTCFNECDALELLAEDEATTVIGLYLESITDGRRFLETAKRVSQQKSIVLLKAGISEHGAQAAASHTGSLAGSDAAINAVCAQAGVFRARSSEEFLNLLEVLSTQPPLLSPNIAIITNAGGPGILATDAAEKAGLTLPALETATEEKLKIVLPDTASTKNPIDVIGDATLDRYEAALTACGHDPNIDGLAVLMTPQVMTPCNDIANAIVAFSNNHPLMPVTTCFMGEENVAEAREIVQSGGVPSFDTPEETIHALASLYTPQPPTTSPQPQTTSGLRATRAAEILEGCTGLISQEKTNELLALYNLELPKQKLTASAEQAHDVADEIGYPVVAKISSPDLLHKTDVGGIVTGIENEKELTSAYEQILEDAKQHAPKAKLEGVLVQEHITSGHEFIIGSTTDPSFGPLIMVGLGGIYTELLKDTAFRIAPIDTDESYRMLRELTSWDILLGMRGEEQSDIDALVETIATISALAAECPQISAIDLNPVLVSQEDIALADVKIIVATKS